MNRFKKIKFGTKMQQTCAEMATYEVKAGIDVIADNTVCSMPEFFVSEVLHKVHYINSLTFFTFKLTNITFHTV